MRNQTRKLMWSGWLACCLLLVSLTGVAADQEIIFEPWPYGLIAYVDVDPGDHVQSDSARLASAVERICEFWDLPVPEPNPTWETALQTTRKTCSSGWMSQLTRLPENSSGITRWWQCKSFWADTVLYECVIAVYPDHESLATSLGYHGIRALFSGHGVGEIPGPAIFVTEQDYRERMDLLVHELTHWLCGSMYGDGLLASRIPILEEGVACVTDREVGGEDRPARAWSMAALYAQEGDLADAPLWLRHDLGETVVDILLDTGIEFRGEASWRCAASSLCPEWRELAAEIDDAWTRAVSQVPCDSPADRAAYKARKQSLYLARDLLDPILSDEARAAYEAVFEEDAAEDSVDRFWDLTSEMVAGPPLLSLFPSEIPWKAME